MNDLNPPNALNVPNGTNKIDEINPLCESSYMAWKATTRG